MTRVKSVKDYTLAPPRRLLRGAAQPWHANALPQGAAAALAHARMRCSVKGTKKAAARAHPQSHVHADASMSMRSRATG
jgi:hypothetical protein